MKIMPRDIRQQTFKRVMRGYDADEVNAFLELISGEMEDMLNENRLLKEKNEILQLDIGKYSNLEKTLQDTLVTAQRNTEEMKQQAHKEARLTVQEAELESEKIMGETRRQLLGIKNDIERLKMQKRVFFVNFKTLIQRQLEMLNILESDGHEDFQENSMQTEMVDKDKLHDHINLQDPQGTSPA